MAMDNTHAIEGISFEQFRAELNGAIARWGDVVCPSGQPTSFVFLLQNETQNGINFNRGGVNINVASVRTLWGDSALYAPGVIAATLVSYDNTTGALVDTDIALNVNTVSNPDGFRFTLDPVADPGARDLATILTHELGHAHGLDHSDQTNTVMNAVYDRITRRRTLAPDDIAAACAIYPPGRIPRCSTPPTMQNGCRCSMVNTRDQQLHLRGWLVLAMLFALQIFRTKCASARQFGQSQPLPARAD